MYPVLKIYLSKLWLKMSKNIIEQCFDKKKEIC